jgi:hypothetical protein
MHYAISPFKIINEYSDSKYINPTLALTNIIFWSFNNGIFYLLLQKLVMIKRKFTTDVRHVESLFVKSLTIR